MDELMRIIERYTEGNYLIGKTTREEMAKDILALFSVVGQSEQFICGAERVNGESKCNKQCNICLSEYGNSK